MKTMYHPKLPLKFILLWVINIALVLGICYATGLQDLLIQIRIKNLAYLYLGLGALLALLEQELWNRLRGNE